MKKLITINIVLAIMLCTIPKPKPKELAKVEGPVQVEAVQVEEIKPVTNRSARPEYTEITKISEQGIKLIKKYEGCRLQAYKLRNEPYYTIGYGHYSRDNYRGQQISQAEAETLLKNDLQRFEGYVRNNCKHLKLNQNEFDALVSFTFNCGQGNLIKLIRNRSKNQIADAITYYTKSASASNKKGLQRRRNEEKNIFLGGY